VFRSVRHAVFWGIAHVSWSGIKSLGVDEIQWQRGHRYLTLVYQIDEENKRLLWIGKERTKETLEKFFHLLGDKARELEFVCSDMWQPYLDVIAQEAGAAIHVLDRYHVMAKMNKAIDEVRAAEAKQLKADGYEPILKNSRWCFLKRPEHLTDQQTVKLSEVLKYNLRSVRAYLQKEEFQRFWNYKSAYWAGRFLDEWCQRAIRSRIEPMQKVARTLMSHRELLLNWFRAKGTISAGVVEGLNNKVKLTMRKSYGFRTKNAAEIALYHNLANLPEPEFTHRFW
jgi:transposase